MTPDRKHSTAVFWLTVALVAVLVGYPVSMGPACWASSRFGVGNKLVTTTYSPLIRRSPPFVRRLLQQYSESAASRSWSWEHADRFRWDTTLIGGSVGAASGGPIASQSRH
jgi:hypothetical protein